MLAAISEWLKNIILVVLFGSFLDLLLPSSGMQRFVRVILGLFILLAVLTPVIDLLQGRIMPEPLPAIGGQSKAAGDRVSGGAERVVRERDRLAVEQYKKDLARQIRAVVMAVDGVADARVAVELAQAADRPFAVAKVIVYVQPGLVAEDRKVARVEIGPAAGVRESELKAAVRDKVVRTVCELYQLSAGQVEVRKMS
jgi:stage III sporulation protein AF